MSTYSAKPTEVDKKWHIIDADGVVLGRLATEVAKILRGKHKPIFTPHIDTGDYVVIINSDKVHLTGKKKSDKIYYRHTGFPGGVKSATPEYLIAEGKSDRIIKKAVERMLPKESPLARDQFSKLKVYTGAEHPHEAQQPTVLDFAAANPKNKRS